MMTPGNLDFTIYQGATFRPKIRLRDSQQNPIDLTGATVRMHIKLSYTSSAVLLALIEENGRALVTDPVNGEISLHVSAEDTTELAFRSGVYDLEVEYVDGTVDRILQGKVKLSPEVTKVEVD
jgi:hypothetical protein